MNRRDPSAAEFWVAGAAYPLPQSARLGQRVRSPSHAMTWVAAAAIALGHAGNAFAQPVPDTVYAPPPIEPDDPEADRGPFGFEATLGYATDYVFRGVERFEVASGEDRANYQAAARASLDLGKRPSPFVSGFANVADSDEQSNLQEVRPSAGLDWDLRLFRVVAGHTFYYFPDRSELDTKEVFASVEFDDAELLGLERSVLKPFAFAAYDYDLYDGLYAEAGLRHTSEVGDTGLTLTLEGLVAYSGDYALLAGEGGETSGFPFYQLGLLGRYDLNRPLGLSEQYGTLSLNGFLYYTDGIDADLRTDTQLWGGAAIGFRF